MSINRAIRDAQMNTSQAVRETQVETRYGRESSLVASLAKSTGVAEGDVARVLEQLGLSASLAEAIRINQGQEPPMSAARIHFRIGRTTIIM